MGMFGSYTEAIKALTDEANKREDMRDLRLGMWYAIAFLEGIEQRLREEYNILNTEACNEAKQEEIGE